MIKGKLASSNFALGNSKNRLPSSARMKVFHYLVNSYITYCALIYSNTNLKELTSLEIMHKKALRHINLAKYNAHTAYLYKKSKILNFSDTIFFQKALFMHNFRHNRLPDSFQNQFSFKSDTNTNRLRHDDGTFDVKNLKYSSPLNASAYSWNSIPFNIRETAKTSTFKKDLKEYLLNKYDDYCYINDCNICK